MTNLMRESRRAALTLMILTTAACGVRDSETPAANTQVQVAPQATEQTGSRLRDIFNRTDPAQIGSVNKYIWHGALELLDFLPVQSIDPFTGIITTGFGTPPGGGKAYRATILVSDPALDPRSLNVALLTRSGPASAATVRAVEDAILARARQLRASDTRF